MGKEIDLLVNYPKTKRDLKDRANKKTDEDRKIARKFGEEFFDGDRKHGYGGFYYNPRFWENVVPTFKEYYNLKSGMKILDVGCGKGFMLYDFLRLIPGIKVKGIDISEYAIEKSLEQVRPYLSVCDAKNLPYEENEFDLVISINTIHNLELNDLKKSLNEINRVSKRFSFITVDAFRNDEEKKAMFDWNLTAKTILSVNDWIRLFNEENYNGDYFWFIP